MPKTPAYRKRSGSDQALVTLTGSATKRRRDYWLGRHGSAESREMYHRVIAAWESNGRRLPPEADFLPWAAVGRRALDSSRAKPAAPEDDRTSVTEIVGAYWAWARENHRAKRANNVKATLRLLRRMNATQPMAGRMVR